MKRRIMLFGPICLLVFMLTGCAKLVLNPHEPLDEPIPLASFTFMVRGMSTASIYSYSAEKTPEGTHLHLELNCGYTVIDVNVDEDVLGELGAIAAKHRLDLWNGFDKSKKRVSDGEGFTLSITTEDGRSIYAHGSNAFPDGFSEANAEIDAVFLPYLPRE